MSAESIEIDFDTADQAVTAYRGEDTSGDGNSNSGNGNDTPGEADWGELVEGEHSFVGGWALWYQPNREDESRRWFVFRTTNSGQFQALNMSGVAEDYPLETGLEELPHTLDRAEAVAAYETWLENADPEDIDRGTEEGRNPGDGDGSGGDGQNGNDSKKEKNWTEWKKMEQSSGWHIFRRQHKYESKEEFFAAGKNAQGENVFLAPGGEIVKKEHIFDYIEDVYAAIEAYTENPSQKDPEDRPTGAPPGQGNLPGDRGSKPPGSNLPVVGPAAQAVGGITNLLLLVGAVAVLFYISEYQGYTNWTDYIEPEGST